MIYHPANIETVSCPRCRREMQFVRSIPKLGTVLPELYIFLCPDCGEVETREIVKAPQAASVGA